MFDADKLNDVMEMDHVIHVDETGDVQETLMTTRPIWAPFLTAYDDGSFRLEGIGWSLINGKSGQYGYSGPLMHASEYIGRGWAGEILSEPGYYVVIPAYDDDGEMLDEWALAYREAD